MFLIVLVFFGAFSLQNQNIEFMAPINLPSVIVYTVYPGASAADVEQDVTKILENDFVTLPNYKSMSSQSSDSLSWITVTYHDGCDPYDQLEEIRYRISTLLDELPSGISGQPQAIVGGASMLPSISFSVDAGNDLGRTTEYIENTLKPKINQVPSVAEVNVAGGKKLQVNIRIRSDDLQARGLPVLQVYHLLNVSNSSLPLGSGVFQGNNISMRYEGSLSSMEDLKNLTVGADDKGNIIRLEDVADVSLGYPEQKVMMLCVVARDTKGQFTERPIAPCGACRQVLVETETRYNQKMQIMLYGTEGIYFIDSARDLLPVSFDSSFL